MCSLLNNQNVTLVLHLRRLPLISVFFWHWNCVLIVSSVLLLPLLLVFCRVVFVSPLLRLPPPSLYLPLKCRTWTKSGGTVLVSELRKGSEKHLINSPSPRFHFSGSRKTHNLLCSPYCILCKLLSQPRSCNTNSCPSARFGRSHYLLLAGL